MLELCRTVRFCLNDPSSTGNGDDVDPQPRSATRNTFSAYPPMRGLGRYYELHVACRGEADPATGYFMNIKRIDTAVRRHAIPVLRTALREAGGGGDLPLGRLLRRMCEDLQPALDGSVSRLTLQLTPMHALSLRTENMDHVEISQQYEFSAAHRLHVSSMSDQRNREVFGKCNNPAGHGHNYRLKVTVRVAIDPAGRITPVDALDALVGEHVIDKLDHKHLNLDVPQFADLNPSVEHIARVIWEMLAGRMDAIGGELIEIGVWETGKTVCTYRGPSGAGRER